MDIFTKLNIYRNAIRHINFYFSEEKKENALPGKMMGEIIRNVHSIEKGLSLEKPRKFFGYKKIMDMFELLDSYVKGDFYEEEVVYMALDAVKEYLEFHKSDSSDNRILEIQRRYENLKQQHDHDDGIKYGGTLLVKKDTSKHITIEKAIHDRHSIRDFKAGEVSLEALKKAIELAYRCPTACNRQGVRTYVISGEKKNALNDWVAGVGGFAEKVDKFIIITGKVSEYRDDEQFQYAISASIFAGYLSITLQTEGIGACIIQRPILLCKKWKKLQKEFNIPSDEQIVLMLGIGILKDEYRVPVSHRLSVDKLVTMIE